MDYFICIFLRFLSNKLHSVSSKKHFILIPLSEQINTKGNFLKKYENLFLDIIVTILVFSRCGEPKQL